MRAVYLWRAAEPSSAGRLIRVTFVSAARYVIRLAAVLRFADACIPQLARTGWPCPDCFHADIPVPGIRSLGRGKISWKSRYTFSDRTLSRVATLGRLATVI